ncbi:MAG: hypothetical protein H0T46_27445 [Deltaproteobacteria bacterium]|nr:hypothetical protein [Deltaproteobacteria bacterium]
MRTRLSFVVALVLAACGSKSTEKESGGGGTGTASGSAPAPVPVATGTQLFVDDKSVATIDAAAVASWPRLDTLLPEAARRMGKWQAITIKNAKPQPAELANPSQAYREYVPALFPGPDGKVSFGMFDPVELGKKGKPALQEDGVTELRIKLAPDSGRGENDHQGGAAIDPQNIKLAIITPKGEQVMTGDKLLALPREAMPGGGGDAKGWRLGVVLEAAGVKSFKRVRLTDLKGPTLTLEKADLEDKATIPFLKLNRQGSLRFRLYKQQGEGWQPAGDLRDLAKIEILE